MHYVKSVCILSYLGPYSRAFGLCISPYSVQLWQNSDQNNSKYRQFLCRGGLLYLICCKQYIDSDYQNSFKPRFRVHESGINTGKDKCGVAKRFSTKYTDEAKLDLHLTEQS